MDDEFSREAVLPSSLQLPHSLLCCPSKTHRNPADLIQFFSHTERVRSYFGHFDPKGVHKHGSRALAHYALKNRADMWSHLVWTGKHSQAPVVVFAKPHYFCELDVVRLVVAAFGRRQCFFQA